MSKLFRNSSPGALTREQAVEFLKKRWAERSRQQRHAEELAAQGRGGDTEIAHATVGEIVLPDALQTPEVLDAIREAAIAANVPLEQLRVGSALNSINPQTGQPEFFDIWPKGGGRYNQCKHGYQGGHCEGWVQDFMQDRNPLQKPTPEELAQLPDAQKQHYAELYEGTGALEDVLGTAAPGLGGLYGKVWRSVGQVFGNAAEEDAATRAEIGKIYRGSINKR
jgi:hypothetical protein